MTDHDAVDGGPAFPCQHQGSTRTDAAGMSLRDYFAAKAMAAIIQTWPHVESGPSTENELLSTTAEDAYRFADAMLIARKEAP